MNDEETGSRDCGGAILLVQNTTAGQAPIATLVCRGKPEAAPVEEQGLGIGKEQNSAAAKVRADTLNQRPGK